MKVFITILLAVISYGLSAQDDGYVYGDNVAQPNPALQSGFDWNRVVVGGGFGMTFGDYTYIEVAPTFGYYLTDNIIAGVGANYIYYEDKIFNYNTNIFGARVFGEYLFENMPLLAHAEVETINFEQYIGKRINIVNLYVGGGIKQGFGNNSYFYILALWNLNETKESLYFNPPSPIIRGGIAIGL